MLHFLDKRVTPPGNGYVYTQTETGQRLRAVSFDLLLKMVEEHRNANNIPMGILWKQEVESQCCKEIISLHPDYKGCVDEMGHEGKYEGRIWSLDDIRRFLQFVITWLAKGGKFVEQAEANRRADMCASCPKNRDVGGCAGCNGIKRLVGAIKGNRHTHRDNDLRVCHACGCWLETKVWIPKDAMNPEDAPYVENCWMREK